MRPILLLLICVFLFVSCSSPAPQPASTFEVATAQTPVLAETLLPSPSGTNAMAAPIPATLRLVRGTETMQAAGSQVAQSEHARLTGTAEAVSTLSFMAARTCAESELVCILGGHFLLQRPIAPAYNHSVDYTYRYGLTQSGNREPHHGVEFPNAQGTPVLAVADGRVVFAGNDKLVSLAWVPAYYGNVVVIEHHLSGAAQTIFSLYAHLYKLNVIEGQQVRVGEQIGQVGATGTAIGSHLHFEVRAAKNDYRSNRNPELWLTTLDGMGVLAGRIQNVQGQPLKGMLNVQRIENGVLNPLPVTSLETYATNELQPVSSDDAWQENFAAGDLPAGEYRLTMVYSGKIYEQVVKIEPGKLTFVRFVLK